MGALSGEVRTEVLCGRICDLEAENAKLREQADFEHFQLGDMKRAADMMLGEFDALANENAKLRELVSLIWHDARLLDANSHIDGLRLTEDRKGDYMRKFRELGIEVDDE